MGDVGDCGEGGAGVGVGVARWEECTEAGFEELFTDAGLLLLLSSSINTSSGFGSAVGVGERTEDTWLVARERWEARLEDEGCSCSCVCASATLSCTCAVGSFGASTASSTAGGCSALATSAVAAGVIVFVGGTFGSVVLELTMAAADTWLTAGDGGLATAPGGVMSISSSTAPPSATSSSTDDSRTLLGMAYRALGSLGGAE